VDTKTGRRRALYDGTTLGLRSAESHITTLNPGATMHAEGHSHPDDEVLIIKEGELEVTLDGVVQTAPAGSMVFMAGNELHGMRNAGDKPVTYYVLRFVPKELLLSAR
jgi:quercetin dioxygenase-like cupin family protein